MNDVFDSVTRNYVLLYDMNAAKAQLSQTLAEPDEVELSLQNRVKTEGAHSDRT